MMIIIIIIIWTTLPNFVFFLFIIRLYRNVIWAKNPFFSLVKSNERIFVLKNIEMVEKRQIICIEDIFEYILFIYSRSIDDREKWWIYNEREWLNGRKMSILHPAYLSTKSRLKEGREDIYTHEQSSIRNASLR